MGGFGSGNWYRPGGKKRTVEECRCLDVADFRRKDLLRFGLHASGSLNWYRGDNPEPIASVGYAVETMNQERPTLRVAYTLADTNQVFDYRIPLAVTRPHFGGQRWWFRCPLVVNDRPCLRRARKLYLRRGYFGCRRCHDLTYESAQEHDKRLDPLCRDPLLLEAMLSRDAPLSVNLLALKAHTQRLRRIQRRLR